MFKLALFVTISAAECDRDQSKQGAALPWHNTGSVKNAIDATRASTLAKEWLDACKTRPAQFQQACQQQCVTALSVAGCESEWDSLARNPTGCNGNKCMGVLQLGCQWLTPQYACKDLAASVFTSKGFPTTCGGDTEPFAAPVLDNAVMQLSQCLLENVYPSDPYSLKSWKNQWSCANSPTDQHYVAAGKLAQTACQQASEADTTQYV